MSRRRARTGRLAVIGNYGARNLGDEATLASVVRNMSRRCPGRRVLALSFDPQDTVARHAIEALPVDPGVRAAPGPEPAWDDLPASATRGAEGARGRVKARAAGSPAAYHALRAAYRTARLGVRVLREGRFALRSLRAFRGVDVLLVAGGGYEDDIGGAWNLPYRLLRWCVIARGAGARVAFVGVGIGPFESAAGRRLIRRSLALACYRSYRDERSRREAAALGPFAGDAVVPDPAFGLDPAAAHPAPAARSAGDGSPSVVGVNPIPYRHPTFWTQGAAGAYEAYVELMAEFVAWLVARGHHVLLFPTQLRSDTVVIADTRRALERHGLGAGDPRVAVAPIATLDDLLEVLAGCDLVVAARFHGVLLALLAGRPTLGLADHFKVTELLAAAGQPDAAVELAGLSLDTLTRAFDRLSDGQDEIRAQVATARDAMVAATERHFDAVARVVAG